MAWIRHWHGMAGWMGLDWIGKEKKMDARCAVGARERVVRIWIWIWMGGREVNDLT
jgi:hypothetical protein